MNEFSNRNIKTAFIMPHSYEYFYSTEMRNFNSLEELDYKILCNSSSSEHKICKASKLAGIEPKYYYLSPLIKKSIELTHIYDYKMEKVPAVNLRGGKYGLFGWQYSKHLIDKVENDNPDVWFVYTYILNRVLPLDMYDILALYCKKGGYPLIARHGGSTAKCTFSNSIPFRQSIKKYTLDIANKIIVPSQKELLMLKNELRISEDKLVCLKDPIPLDIFHPITKNKAAAKIGKDPNKRYILYVGRLNEAKGIHHILNVLPKLIKYHKDIVLLIVGTGSFGNELRKQVVERKLKNYVIFEKYILPTELKYYYSIADVLVLASYAEGTPNVVQEAVACNTPIVATEVGGIPEILSENMGIIIPPKNDMMLFEGIKKILDEKFEINQEKRNKLLNEWSMEYYGTKIKEMCEEALS